MVSEYETYNNYILSIRGNLCLMAQVADQFPLHCNRLISNEDEIKQLIKSTTVSLAAVNSHAGFETSAYLYSKLRQKSW